MGSGQALSNKNNKWDLCLTNHDPPQSYDIVYFEHKFP